jgi:hypothetical protein
MARRAEVPARLSLTSPRSRIFAISERFTPQLRAEAFNIINHPNFGKPSANISTGNVGTITATSFDRLRSGGRGE